MAIINYYSAEVNTVVYYYFAINGSYIQLTTNEGKKLIALLEGDVVFNYVD